MKGRYLEHLSWPEAEEALKQHAMALLPVGARCKEHGHHLPLNTDWRLAEYFTKRIVERCDVLALPTVQYGYYPAFVEYPGSIHIERDTFSRFIADICRSIHRHGARRIYVLNTGISTNWALEPARLTLADQSIAMEFTDLLEIIDNISATVRKQPFGTHADEVETSMMLYIQPDVVRMDLAKPDLHERDKPGPLTRDPNATDGLYSPTGAWGDPTLATADKGRIVVEALIDRIAEFIDRFADDQFTPAPPRTRYLQR